MKNSKYITTKISSARFSNISSIFQSLINNGIKAETSKKETFISNHYLTECFIYIESLEQLMLLLRMLKQDSFTMKNDNEFEVFCFEEE